MSKEISNPYAPPTSDVGQDAAVASGMYFFTTSTNKLVLMSIFTMGIYQCFWFYKNWVLMKTRIEKNIMPIWRALFAPLWAYSCFDYIKIATEENEIEVSYPIGFLAVLYIILGMLWRLPDPYWLVTMLSFVPMIQANNVALKVNEYLIEDFKNNESFSKWNWLCVILGGLFWLLVIIGLFIPEV